MQALKTNVGSTRTQPKKWKAMTNVQSGYHHYANGGLVFRLLLRLVKNLSCLAREISWLLKNEQPNASSLDAAARLVYPLIYRDTFLVHKNIFNSLLSTPHTAVCERG